MSLVASTQYFTTGVQKETIDFQWEIPGYQNIRNYLGAVQLQKICLVSQDGSKWHLSMQEKKDRYEREMVTIYCTLECTPALERAQQLAIFEIHTVNASGENVLVFDTTICSNGSSKQIGEKPISHQELQEIGTCQNPPLVNGALKMKGKLTIYIGTNQSTATPKYVSNNFEKISVKTQQQELGQLFLTASESDKFSDIKFCTDDGTIIPAHRGILVARSEYFNAMLTTRMIERKSGKISVEGIKGKSMISLLYFLYSGCLSEDWNDHEVLHDLTKAAHFYQVSNLVDFLDKNIAKVCEHRSAGDLLLLCKTLEMKIAEEGLRLLIKKRLKEFNNEPEFDDLLISIAKRQKVLE